MSFPKGQTAELKDDLRRCAASLKEGADRFRTAIEGIEQVLSGLISASTEKVDGPQIEAAPVNDPQRLLTVKEVAAYLNVSDRAIYLWVKNKNLPHRKVGEDLRFDLAEVDAWTRPEPNALEKAPLHVVK
jgi:excisionase family DNA binding protein